MFRNEEIIEQMDLNTKETVIKVALQCWLLSFKNFIVFTTLVDGCW